MKKNLILIMILSLLTITVAAQTADVEYVDGYAWIITNNQETEIYFGDEISLNETIELEEDSTIKLVYQGSVLTINREGTYNLAELFSASRKMDDNDLSGALASRFKFFMGEGPAKPTQVGGVRAAKQEDDSSITWITSEIDEYVKEIKNAIENDDLDSAEALIEEAYDFVFDEEEEYSLMFYEAYLSMLDNDTRTAAATLSSFEPEPGFREYDEYFLLYSQLLISFYAFDDLIDFSETYEGGTVEVEQELLLLQGIAFSVKEQPLEARRSLNKAIELRPDSAIAEDAEEWLKEL